MQYNAAQLHTDTTQPDTLIHCDMTHVQWGKKQIDTSMEFRALTSTSKSTTQHNTNHTEEDSAVTNMQTDWSNTESYPI